MRLTTFLFLILLAITGCQKSGKIELPSLIGDNMILQQNTNAIIWGKSSPDQKISVTASWNANGQTKASEDGKWSVSLPTPDAGGPYTITVSGRDTIILINNVLIGEVWFCSGQSNMEMPMEGWPPIDTIMHSSATIASSSNAEIRLYNVLKKISGEPLDDCTGKWEVSSPETVSPFSATAYFFGKKLYDELHVPIGLIESAWGGTPAESWISAAALEKSGDFTDDLQAIKESSPLQNEYQIWLNSLKQLEVKPGGTDQWVDLNFDDDEISTPGYDDTLWPEMDLPSLFEKVIGEFDGVVWFRRTIGLDQDIAGKDLVLSLGPIDDMDRTYFNGELVGSTELAGNWQVDRNYDIPGALVKSGQNIISVRVLDTQGGGGIFGNPDKMELTLKSNNKKIVTLNGKWKYQPVADLSGNKFYIFDIAKNEFISRKRPRAFGPNTPSVLFNGMVNPVLPYQIRGAIWYQGESNVGRAEQYGRIFPVMIQNWRDAWNIKDFPFYFVQIAPYIYSGLDSIELAPLREAQEKALDLPNTGMVSTLDIATVMNIHPPLKKEVGERLALLALNNDYGKKNQCNGPIYKSMIVEGNTIKLQFQNADDGLIALNNELKEFEIAGKDGRYVKANARISNNEVYVSSVSVTNPVSVRYCWRNGSEASLFNKSGLPAWQFRTK